MDLFYQKYHEIMRRHVFPVSVLLVAAFVASISAQQPAGRPAAQPKPTPAATAPAAPATVQLPMSKMAVIYTDMFLDQKTGISKFTNLVTKLNSEFQKPKDDLTQMQTRATTLESEITKLRGAPEGTPIDQRSLQAKIDQLDQLKKDIQRKAEDAQGLYTHRRQELFRRCRKRLAKRSKLLPRRVAST